MLCYGYRKIVEAYEQKTKRATCICVVTVDVVVVNLLEEIGTEKPERMKEERGKKKDLQKTLHMFCTCWREKEI